LKKTAKIIKAYLPNFLKQKVDAFLLKGKVKKSRERKKRVYISESEMRGVIDGLDLSSDLMIHASMSNIGKFEGGATAIVNAILSRVDVNKNTVIAPALPFLGSMKEYLDTLVMFDVSTAKNSMGAVSSLIMKRKDSLRSIHPTHSVVAIGRDSSEYIGSHHFSVTPFDSMSPYRKLAENNGKILMFGVNLNSVTNFHVYEDMLGDCLSVDVYTKKIYEIDCIGDNVKTRVATRAHNVVFSSKRDCELARDELVKCGAIKTQPLGDSEVSILDAKKLNLTLLKMLKDGKSIYGKVHLNEHQTQKVDSLIKELL